MTDDDLLEGIERAASQLVPQLTERLSRHGLGEIEVRHGRLRVRVAAAGDASGGAADAPSVAVTAAGPGDATDATSSAAAVGAPPDAAAAVSSPAVGFFVYADGLGPGLSVEKGDALGYVEMLGVRHDVRSPRRGTVRNLVAETGEAVEYGQVVIELETGAVGG